MEHNILVFILFHKLLKVFDIFSQCVFSKIIYRQEKLQDISQIPIF